MTHTCATLLQSTTWTWSTASISWTVCRFGWTKKRLLFTAVAFHAKQHNVTAAATSHPTPPSLSLDTSQAHTDSSFLLFNSISRDCVLPAVFLGADLRRAVFVATHATKAPRTECAAGRRHTRSRREPRLHCAVAAESECRTTPASASLRSFSISRARTHHCPSSPSLIVGLSLVYLDGRVIVLCIVCLINNHCGLCPFAASHSTNGQLVCCIPIYIDHQGLCCVSQSSCT